MSWFIHITLNLTPESEAYIGKIGVKRGLGKGRIMGDRLEVEFHNRWAQGHKRAGMGGAQTKGQSKDNKVTAYLKNVPRSILGFRKAGFLKLLFLAVV